MKMVSIRASSLPDLLDCPARWEARHLLGRRLPSSGIAQLGIAVHAGTALFDQAHLDGADITADDAAGAVVDAIYRPDREVDWTGDRPEKIERIALSLHRRYCAEIAPNRDYVGVEVLCEALAIEDLGLTLTGTTDRIRIDPDGQLGICDIKTGERAVTAAGVVMTQSHIAQMGVYELIAEAATGQTLTAPAQIIGMQTGKTAAAQRIGVGEIGRARELLVGDGETPGLLEYASRIIHSGLFYGNPKSMTCHPKYCPLYATCKFRG